MSYKNLMLSKGFVQLTLAILDKNRVIRFFFFYIDQFTFQVIISLLFVFAVWDINEYRVMLD